MGNHHVVHNPVRCGIRYRTFKPVADSDECLSAFIAGLGLDNNKDSIVIPGTPDAPFSSGLNGIRRYIHTA